MALFSLSALYAPSLRSIGASYLCFKVPYSRQGARVCATVAQPRLVHLLCICSVASSCEACVSMGSRSSQGLQQCAASASSTLVVFHTLTLPEKRHGRVRSYKL